MEAALRSSAPAVYLTFALGENLFGLSMDRVQEIVRLGATTPVPLTPPWIRGVFNLRGRVLPAVDLAVRLGLPRREATSRSCLLMLQMAVQELAFSTGIIVDEVLDLVDIQADAIEPVPTFGTGIRVEFVEGIFQTDKGPLLLLDVVRVFEQDELLQIALAEQKLRREAEERTRAAATRPGPKLVPAATMPEGSGDGDLPGIHLFDEE